ncbi:MAG: ATP-binding protein [Rhodobacteraceae bacterium]|nr:ATP-binding protein [Paracoccaceae bacterium]
MLTESPARAGGIGPGGAAPAGCDLFHIAFLAEPNAVRDALRRAVARFARRITSEDAGTLELALAEVLNNVAEHGYADLPPGPVRLDLRRADGALECLVEDEGHPMPGLVLPEGSPQPVAATVEGLAEGGWGWALIRDLTTDILYTRDDGRNRLTFRIPLATQ